MVPPGRGGYFQVYKRVGKLSMSKAFIDLSGIWQLVRADLPEEKIDAAIPGDNASALVAAGKMPDPYFRRNELQLMDFMNYDWEFSRCFEVPASLLEYSGIFLNAEMFDTFGEISINGNPVGETGNQFRRYRFEVKKFLRPGMNTIAVRFRSAAMVAAERGRQLKYPIPYTGHMHMPHLNLIRKTQCSAGWDWGICLPTSGIYERPYLQAVKVARIEALYTRQEHTPGHCRVVVCAELYSETGGSEEFTCTFNGETRREVREVAAGNSTLEWVFEVDNPRLWWPNGYGKAELYDLELRTETAVERRRIGLRRLLVLNERDEVGASLVIEVNGVPVFAKGANWIPADAMPSRQTRERFVELLSSARDANMNIIRVWGGGEYERDEFYDLCDEYGILIWHDMMFSCSLYPADREFLRDVAEEANFQVRRLRHHASLALWCGDNECIGALNWFEESRNKRDLYLLNYDRLNRVLDEAVYNNDPERMFWPSSPCGGPGNFDDNWLSDSFGDMHYWQVWHGAKDFDAYYRVQPRFCSEFGFQSFPSLETVESFALPEDFNVFSPVLDHHQRCPMGNKSIIGMFGVYFRMPSGFGNFLYLSQAQQALAIKTGVEYWRTLRPRCMGTIFWQLNDNWPVASWSSIEYGGRWKQLHYQARRFYAPVIGVAANIPGVGVRVCAVNDLPRAVAVELKMTMRDFAGNVLKNWEFRHECPGAGSHEFVVMSAADFPAPFDTGFLELETTGVDAEGRSFCHENTAFLTPPKCSELAETRIEAEITGSEEEPGAFRIRLTSGAPAFFVWLAVEGDAGRFSDNSFTLLPDRPVELAYRAAGKLDCADLKRRLRIVHLRETY